MKAPPPLLLVVQKLGPLRDRVVFVGGMIRGLLTTDPAAGPMRATDDVDMIVRDIDSIAGYHALGAELRNLGFCEDTRDDAPLCRWIVEGVTTDITPIDPAALGFSNVWYESAQRHVSTAQTSAGALHHLDAPHFCATKLEAFAGRGAGDYYHHDLEDFIALVDERPTLLDEIASTPSEVREFIAQRVQDLLSTAEFRDALPGHMSGDEVSQQRLPAVTLKLQNIAALLEPQPPAEQQRGPVTRVRTVANRTASADAETNVSLSPASGSLRIPLRSSNLAWVEYDATQQRLDIGFRSHSAYSYSNVPVQVYQGLLDAYSKGRYFNVWIKPRYPTRRIR